MKRQDLHLSCLYLNFLRHICVFHLPEFHSVQPEHIFPQPRNEIFQHDFAFPQPKLNFSNLKTDSSTHHSIARTKSSPPQLRESDKRSDVEGVESDTNKCLFPIMDLNLQRFSHEMCVSHCGILQFFLVYLYRLNQRPHYEEGNSAPNLCAANQCVLSITRI
jgi:hypothetical protein